ncbi:unnamed protein product [Paramecium sonneborni]|uniref:PIPK domain-containing protein n=1 Tax=Paramecium sonneborni TaxID=65129 RepID=A0A8S1RQ75_9CILI|nr:unnamed protein product [Paramecium sonneborni]
MIINYYSKQSVNKNYQLYFKIQEAISQIYMKMIHQYYQNIGQESKIFIMMKNALQIPSNYVLKTYNLKGSEFQRKVLKSEDFKRNLRKTTLKDIDFKEAQVKLLFLKLNQKFRILLKFEHNGLFITYYQNELVFFLFQVFSILNQVLSFFKEKGIYYHNAINDYLQIQNAEKMIEQVTKIGINFSKDLDYSAKNP